jgi:hypothetical protein
MPELLCQGKKPRKLNNFSKAVGHFDGGSLQGEVFCKKWRGLLQRRLLQVRTLMNSRSLDLEQI